MIEPVEKMAEYATIPILAKPNAGLPELENGVTVYKTGPEEFASCGKKLVEAGASIIGGCCGTTPEHIRALKEAVKDMPVQIVDDLAAERTLLKGRLEWQLQRRKVQADILEYESGETFLEAARKAPFTAAFLDIYMDGMTGMEAAKKLRKTDTDCLLVFITTSTDHALEGFQVRALHYLVKPLTEADIDALTDELLACIPQPDKYMELKVEGSEIHLRYQDIIYAEHFAHLIYVHTTVQKTLATRQPFKTFIASLKDDTRFFVCGRGVIVNLEHAKDLEGAAFRMADGSRVFVSQDLLKSARQALMEFLLQRGRMV